MWKYVPGVEPPPPKVRKTTEENLEMRRKYEATRTRNFQHQWLQTFSWLEYKPAHDTDEGKYDYYSGDNINYLSNMTNRAEIYEFNFV